MSEYEKLTLALQVVVSIAAFASLAFLYRQVRVMIEQIVATQEASRAQSALAIVGFLQSADVRAARHCVRSVLSSKHHSQWSDEEKNNASLVCANYDVAAGLLRAKLAPTDLIIVNWGPSIIHCHEILSQFMTDVRSKPGGHPEYWRNFDWLRAQVTHSKP
jgi:hypothetical protein